MIEYKQYAGPPNEDDPTSLKKVFEHLQGIGEPIPNPMLSIAFTAEKDGEIVALTMIQCLPVIEPAKAEPGYGRHLGVLFKKAYEFIVNSGAPRALCHTEHRAMRMMLKHVGAEEFAVTFYQWFKPGFRPDIKLKLGKTSSEVVEV